MILSVPAGYPKNATDAFGRLTALDSLSIDDVKTLALIEASGKSLYAQLAACCDNAEIKSLLNKNGQEEVGHAHRMLKVLSILTGEQFELPADEDNPFIGPSPFTELSTELLQSFIEGEMAGEVHYNRWADNAGNDQVAAIYRLVGADERRHAARDQQALDLLQG